jgi:flagellar assembly factor FliW
MERTDTTDTQGSEILFSEGIIGVSRARRFQLLEREESPIRVLRCLDIEGFALPVVDPRLVDPDYRPAISTRVTEALGLDAADLLLLLAVTTLEPEGPVANLRAPLVINVERRLGAQVILDDRRQPLRARLATKV